MPFALELFFDPSTDREVREAWRSLAKVSGSHYLEQNGVRPHVALAVFEATSEKVFHGWRKILSAADGVCALEEEGRGSFPAGISFVRLRRTPSLMALHQRVMDFCDHASLQVSPHYRTDTWVSHCTLAQNFPAWRINEVDCASNELRFSCSWTIASVGIVRFPPSAVIDEEEIGF
jgi:hypothetical protein